MHPESISCADTLARLTRQGKHTVKGISEGFYTEARWDWFSAHIWNERVVRRALIQAVAERTFRRKDLDEAYWEALRTTGTSGNAVGFWRADHLSYMRANSGHEVQNPADRRLINSAYQNFTAGRLAGIDEVGSGLFGQALIDLGWARDDSVEQAISYFKGAYQSTRNVLIALFGDPFGQIFKYARKAGLLEYIWADGGVLTHPHFADRFPEWISEIDIRNSDLSWILDIPAGYRESEAIHHAIISNPEFKNAIDSAIPY